MFLIFDFQCNECGAVSEHMVKRGDANPVCPVCSNPATTKLVGAPKLGITAMAASGKASSDATTTAVDKWAKARNQKWNIEQRNLRNHGTYD